MAKITKEAARKALMVSHGILTTAAQMMGCSRPGLASFIKRHPELEEVRQEAEVQLIDVAESLLAINIKTGDMKSIRWFLERKGKDRGYTTRVEQTGADGGPVAYEKVEVEVVDPSADVDGEAEAG